ncbi:MAG: hypothetical protein MEQ07_11130 [Aquimonas sp.]|nr:hypothetical protein [Aquimonas sp.]
MSTPLDQIPAEDFAALVGQGLPAQAAEQRFELHIQSVDVSPHPSGRSLPGFAVQLRAPAGLELGQGVFAIEHPRHGALEVFMTPIRRDPSGLLYEAVFN